MNFVEVVGIAATDQHHNIAVDGKPVAFLANATTRKLDQSVLRSILRGKGFGIETSHGDFGLNFPYQNDSSLVVIGEGTFLELKNSMLGQIIRDSGCGILASSATEYTFHAMNESKSFGWDTSYSTKEQLLEVALREVYEHDIDQIIVLGGVSVYEAFAGHYTEFHESTFKIDNPKDKCLPVPINSIGVDSLITTRYTYRPIDTSMYRYQIHSLGELK